MRYITLGIQPSNVGSSPGKALLKQLKLLPFKLVAVGDNDPAGEKFARKLNGFVSPVDVDEMSTENLKNFCYG